MIRRRPVLLAMLLLITAGVAGAIWLLQQQKGIADIEPRLPDLVLVDPAATGDLRIEVGFDPESVTVGDPFRAAVRVTAPFQARITYGPLETTDSIQSVVPMRLVGVDGADSVALYTLVAWVAGVPLADSISIQIAQADGTYAEQKVALALPGVASVLPAGVATADLEPRPGRGVLTPPGEGGWPWWWLALFLAAIAAVMAYWWTRRHADRVPEELGDPVEWALAQLDSIRLAADSPPAEIAEAYRRSSRVLRCFLCRLHPGLGLDLTTSELLAGSRSAEELGEAGRRELRSLLEMADRVKFAAFIPASSEASASLARTREWVVAHAARIESAPEEATRRAA